MNPLAVAALVAVLVGGAAWSIGRALVRAPLSVSAARDQMFGRGDEGVAAWHRTFTSGRPTEWMERTFGSDLELVDLTPADVATRVVLTAVGFFLAVLALTLGLGAAGVLPFALWWPMVALVVGVLAGWVAFRGVAERVERARKALRQAANDFVQLVAVGLTTDQSVEEAIGFALAVGTGDAFDRLRRPLTSAPQRGVPVWDAIEEFARRFDVRELSEFAVSVERQGTQGVSIGDTVAALAAGMRARALDELERDADRANANLSGPTIGFVVATVVFLAYPLAQRISDAFGG